MIRMTDLLNDELDSIMAHCMDVCDSDSFDDDHIRLVGSPDLHDEHVLTWKHMDDDDFLDDDDLEEGESTSLDRIHNSHVLKHAWRNKDRNWWKTW